MREASTAAASVSQRLVMSRRYSSGSSRNRRVATVGFAALVALTRRTTEAQAAYENYPLVGCFKDYRSRAMEFNTNTVVKTLEACAVQCIGHGKDFFGIEYEHEW